MKKLMRIGFLTVLGVFFCSAMIFAYSAPTKNAHFFGDANGDLVISPADITQHQSYMNGKTYSYDTLQPNISGDRWNTCDLNHDKSCTQADITQMLNHLNGKNVTLGNDDPWGIVSTLTSPQQPLQMINFQAGLYATPSSGQTGIPGISIEVTVDNANSTITGYLVGRDCAGGTGDVPAPAGAQCAIGVAITQWGVDPLYGWTELSPLPLGVYADGNGVIELDFEMAAKASLDLPQLTFSQQITFSGVIPDQIAINCPANVNETDGISCPVTTASGPSACAIGPNDTCGGSIDAGCVGPYTAPAQGEAAGPGSCVAHVVKGTASDQHTITIDEVNQNPYFTSTAPTSATEGVAFSYNPTYADDDLPNTNPGDPGYVTCAVSGNTCGAWLSFTGCNASGTPGEADAPGSCGYTLTVTDGYSATAQQNVSLTLNEVNQAPYFTSTAPTSATEGVAFSYNPTYADNDLPNSNPGDPGYMNCMVSSSTCGWLSFTGCNASGTPTIWGGCNYTLILSDGEGLTAQQMVNLLIEPVSGWGNKISAGYGHTCALTPSGGVKCWGRNDQGQVGDGTTTWRSTPVDVSGLSSGVNVVSAGGLHSCAVTQSGGVKCWGRNNNGQLGDGTTTTRTTPIDVSGLTSGVSAVSAGDLHTCALTQSGGVKCWGANWDGQVGNGTSGNYKTTPVDVSELSSGVIAVSAGGYHTCALTQSGGVKCWGANWYGQLGDRTTVGKTTPVDVEGLTSGASAISAGEYHTCALTQSGGIKCWGRNNNGQLGDGTTTDRLTPVDVSGLTSGVSVVSTGDYHTCALTQSGGVKCWGYNAYGQLGDGTYNDSSTSVDVAGLTSEVIVISAGGYHSCALTQTGGLKCWGRNNTTQLGDGTFNNSPTPVNVSGVTSGVIKISSGENHTCALTQAKGVKCWGSNWYGQLGNGTYIDIPSPVDVTGLSAGVNAIVAGSNHTCALTEAGGVKCWGYNEYGQLGDGTLNDSPIPVDVYGLSAGVISITGGAFHTCALTQSGGVKCWGRNYHAQLGDGTTTDRLTPVDVSGLTSGVIAISAGWLHTCALTQASGVKCWGLNNNGQLGDGTTTMRTTPIDVSGLTSGVLAISGGGDHTCALTQTGGVKCWGWNYYAQLGDGTTIDRHTPADVSGLTSGVSAISAGGYHTCALTQSEGVKCWGDNTYGQVGDGTTTRRTTPVGVSELTSDVTAISAGDNHTCALTQSAQVKCWGSNSAGQLGDGSYTWRSTPVYASGFTSGGIAVSAGGWHTCALTDSGGVKSWGYNADGELGNDDYSDSSIPVDVSGLISGVMAISAGMYHSCAVTQAGGVKCWGYNGYGQLGDGTYDDSPIPVDVAGLSSGVASVTAGEYHTCALTQSGGVKCWGDNNYGQLGDGTTIDKLTPVDVSGLTSGVAAVSAGGYHTCALTQAGGVKCWGYNSYGQLGDGTTTRRTTPVNVTGLTSGASAVSAGGYHTCALTQSGGVKCWGYNGYGQLGDNTTTRRTTPVDVSGLTWGVSAVSGGNYHTCALTQAGGIKCWGSNEYGQIGDGTTVDRTTPINVLGLTSEASAISGGYEHTCAVTQDGGIKCWGNSYYGELGDGEIGYRTTPVDVLGLTLW